MGFDRTLGGGLHDLQPARRHRLAEQPGQSRRRRSLPVVEAIYTLYANAFAQLRPHHRRVNLDKASDYQLACRAAADPAQRLRSGATLLSPHRLRLAQWRGPGDRAAQQPQRARVAAPDSARNLDPARRSDSREIFSLRQQRPRDAVQPAKRADVEQGRLFVVPARNVMHLRWRTPRHPLVGESPFAAAGLAAGVNVALSRTQLLFVENMRRISTVLSDRPC